MVLQSIVIMDCPVPTFLALAPALPLDLALALALGLSGPLDLPAEAPGYNQIDNIGH